MPRQPYDYFPAPPSGYSRGGGGGTLLDLIMRRGDIAAQSALDSGNIWGNAIQGIGQSIGAGLEQRSKEKQLKKRDAAWLGFLERGDWSADPKAAYAETLKIWGPEEGPKQFQGLVGVSQLMQPKRDQAADMKALGAVGGAMGKMSDQGRAMLWPQARKLATGAFPDVPLPEQYDPQTWAQLQPLFGQLSGESDEYTLNPGDKRFKGGQMVAENAKPPEPPKKHLVTTTGPGGVPIQKLATEEELAAGIPGYRAPAGPKDEPLVAIMGPDGEPVLVPRGQAAGKRPASTREQGRPVTSGDANRLSDFDTSLDDLKVLSGAITGATGVSARIGAALPNVVTEVTGIGADAKAKQATIDRVKQVIGKALEGGVLRKEDESKYEKILPTIGDPPEVVTAKLRGLEQAIKQRRSRLVESLGDAGYETSRYQGRSGGGTPAGGGLSDSDSALLKKYGY